jgi:hypothetical protein
MTFTGAVESVVSWFHSATHAGGQQSNDSSLFRQLSEEQKRRVLAYKGPEASGDQTLPKIKR